MTKSNKSALFFCRIFSALHSIEKVVKNKIIRTIFGAGLIAIASSLLLKTPVVRFGKQLSIPSPPVWFPKKTLPEAIFPTLGSE